MDPIKIGGAAAESAIVIESSPAILIDAIDKQLTDAKERGEVHEIVAFDAPKRALRQLISEGTDERVGGSIQQAWATVAGFQIVSNANYTQAALSSQRWLVHTWLRYLRHSGHR